MDESEIYVVNNGRSVVCLRVNPVGRMWKEILRGVYNIRNLGGLLYVTITGAVAVLNPAREQLGIKTSAFRNKLRNFHHKMNIFNHHKNDERRAKGRANKKVNCHTIVELRHFRLRLNVHYMAGG